MIGQTVSHYKILEKLGAGGMGVVYKAQDLKLNRTVALKFLSLELTADSDAVNRFINEAQTASALDHANICTIHEIDETADGQLFICMAYYEGETLRKQVARGKLQVEKAIDIAKQIATGLQRAHEAGITHRDFRPENIIITTRGEIKIIDFGLAKLAGQTRLTKTGSTLGTMMYMSPEQLQGKEVDHRTDIWALGVLLYEMLAGQPPFRGDYEAALVYAIAHETYAPLTQLRPEIPDWLQSIVDKTLEKNPETRYQDLSEFLEDLQSQYDATPAAMKRVTKPRAVRKKLLKPALLAAAFITLSLLAFVLYRFLPKVPAVAPATHKQITFVGDASFPAISPDGKMVAYVSYQSQPKAKVYVQDLASGEPLPILSDIPEVTSLRWSPDGAELLVGTWNGESFDGLIVPRLGGKTRHIENGEYLSLSPDGLQIATVMDNSKGITFINRATFDTTFIRFRTVLPWIYDIDWSPLQDRILVLVTDYKKWVIWAVQGDGSSQQEVVQDSVRLYSPRWSAVGKSIYYLRPKGPAFDLVKIEVSSTTGKALASSKVVQSGILAGLVFSISSDNRQLLYTRELSYSNLWLVSLDDQGKGSTPHTRKLTTGTSSKYQPAISPDGKHVAYSMADLSSTNIFVMPIEGGESQRVSQFDAYSTGAAWSPDGKEIAFVSSQNKKRRIWKVNSNGGTPRPLSEDNISISSLTLTWAPGSEILYQLPGNRNFRALNPETKKERLLVPNDSVGWMFYPCYSHDGKKLAVFWNRFDEKNQREHGVWLISLQDSSQSRLQEGFFNPIEWSGDNEWIYAIDPYQKPYTIIRISVRGGEAIEHVTLPFEDINADLTMTPDGKRIVCSVNERQADVWLMANFDREVE
jgi:serine/threonine protein kinase